MKNKYTLFISWQILIFLVIFSFGCSKETVEEDLDLIAEYSLDFPEPSGLCLSNDNEALWSVSDSNSNIYRISLEGKILGNFNVDGDDLEGITVVNDTLLAVVLERKREILLTDLSGKETKRYKLQLEGEENLGLEGITYDKNNKQFYIVNEKQPRLLLVLDESFAIINTYELNFIKDVSGIFYDTNKSILWILSDESQSINKCDLSGNLLQSYRINVTQPEGISVDVENRKIYIVSDLTQKLYLYKME